MIRLPLSGQNKQQKIAVITRFFDESTYPALGRSSLSLSLLPVLGSLFPILLFCVKKITSVNLGDFYSCSSIRITSKGGKSWVILFFFLNIFINYFGLCCSKNFELRFCLIYLLSLISTFRWLYSNFSEFEIYNF